MKGLLLARIMDSPPTETSGKAEYVDPGAEGEWTGGDRQGDHFCFLKETDRVMMGEV